MTTTLNDKTKLKALRADIEAALAPLLAKHNLTSLKTGTISYEADGTSAKIQLKAEATSADGKNKDQAAFDRYHALFGLQPEHYGATFTSGMGTFRLVGIAPTRSKFPIIAENTVTGKRMLFTTEGIINKLKLNFCSHLGCTGNAGTGGYCAGHLPAGAAQ